MGPYEYLTIFVAVILGLAVVNLLGGVASVLDSRFDQRLDWIHSVWTLNVLLTTLLVWWFNFDLTTAQVWTLPHFLNLVAYVLVLYLMSGLLYPVRGEEVVDFRIHFEANRPRFFALGVIFQTVDFAETILTRQALGTDWNVVHLVSIVVFGAAFLVAIRSSNRTYHRVLALAWLMERLWWGVSALGEPLTTL